MTNADGGLNVLMVLADQHHADVMGCAGHPQAITPNIDRLAAQGVRFERAYAQSVICTPNRVSILSGQYCHNHGYFGNGGPTPTHLPNLFGHFHAHGYRTAGLGAMCLPHAAGYWIAPDVDLFGGAFITSDGTEEDSPYMRYLDGLGLLDLIDSGHNRTRTYGKNGNMLDARTSLLPYEHTLEVWCARQAMSFIDQAPDQPFFIQTAFMKPHHPLLPQQRFWDLYPDDLALPDTFEQDPSHRPPHFQRTWHGLRNMAWDYAQPGDSYVDGARRAWHGTLACVSQIDDVLGMLLDGLEERGLAQRTIVIYGSDHGGYHTIHGLPEKAPGICSDAVCRVPMIWRVPGVTSRSQAAGSVCSQLVENIDMAATLPGLCGLPPMTSTDGRDVTSLLAGEDESVRRVAVSEHPWSKAIRWGSWRLVHYQPEMFASQTQGDAATTPDVGELYHLDDDPNETRNLYHDPQYKPIVEEGRRLLLEWLIRTTRIITCHPPMAGDGQKEYDLAGDGKEANTAGPALRVKNGNVNYI